MSLTALSTDARGGLVAGVAARRALLVRLDATGRRVPDFGTDGVRSEASVSEFRAVRWERGRLLASADDLRDDTPRAVVLRYDARGHRDRSWGRRGRARPYLPRGYRASAAGQLLVRGSRVLMAGTLYDGNVGIREDFGFPHLAVIALRR